MKFGRRYYMYVMFSVATLAIAAAGSVAMINCAPSSSLPAREAPTRPTGAVTVRQVFNDNGQDVLPARPYKVSILHHRLDGTVSTEAGVEEQIAAAVVYYGAQGMASEGENHSPDWRFELGNDMTQKLDIHPTNGAYLTLRCDLTTVNGNTVGLFCKRIAPAHTEGRPELWRYVFYDRHDSREDHFFVATLIEN